MMHMLLFGKATCPLGFWTDECMLTLFHKIFKSAQMYSSQQWSQLRTSS